MTVNIVTVLLCAVVFKGFTILFCQDIQKHFDKESEPEGYDISVSVMVTSIASENVY